MADPIFDKRRLIRATGQSPAALAVTEGAVPAVVSPVQRFVVGRDQLPHSLSEPELAALGDPFARLVLRRGERPMTVDALLERLDALSADPVSDDLADAAVPAERVFLVGEC